MLFQYLLEVPAADDIRWTEKILQNLVEKAVDMCAKYGGRLIIALIFVLLGFKLVKLLKNVLKKAFSVKNMELSVQSFLLSLINIVLKIVILLTAASIIGIQMTSFITLFGTAGIAVGLALQGSLANLAGGVLVLMLRPYKVGDYIKTSSGEEGTVASIDIFYTHLKTTDNQMIVIPNGELSNSSITNVTKAEFRRVDLTVGVSYEEDIKKVKQSLQKVIDAESRIDKDKSIDVFVDELADSSIQMGIHAWVKTDEYWAVRWKLLEDIKEEFDKEKITIPYNILDVNLNSANVQP